MNQPTPKNHDAGAPVPQRAAELPYPRRIATNTFPDQPRPGATQLPLTIENLEHLLAEGDFFPRFNVIKKRIELRRGDGSLANFSQIISLAILNGFGTSFIREFIDEIANRRPHNPVRDWISSMAWDGKDRLPDVYATISTYPGYPAGLKDALLYRWLLSATAAAMRSEGFYSRGVLTLQGRQGIGKTSWVAALVSPGLLRNEMVKRDHHLDGGNKDSIIGAVTHWIVEIGELDSSFKKDIARLKGFLTNDCDKLRRPYGRDEAEYPRRTVFAATVNEVNFLVDPTGNSRWWTIAVEQLDHRHSIDMQQVYAQLALAVEAGEQWWLTDDEERRLEEYNVKHRSVSAIVERVSDALDLDKADGITGTNMTAIEVLREAGINHPSNVQCKECGAFLRDLLGDPTRVQGRYKWRVPLKSDRLNYPAKPESNDVY